MGYQPPPLFSSERIEMTDLSAEQVQNISKSISAFSGNVQIERHQLRIKTDHATHNKKTQKLELNGHIHIDTDDMAMNATSGWLIHTFLARQRYSLFPETRARHLLTPLYPHARQIKWTGTWEYHH